MIKSKFIFLVPAVFLLAGCICSLNPLYTDKDVVFDQRLVGEWTDGTENTVTYTEQAAKAASKNEFGEVAATLRHYECSSKDGKGRVINSEVHLVRIGKMLFLDYYPAKGKQAEIIVDFGFPVHWFVRVWFVDADTIRIAGFDPSWAEKTAGGKRPKIAYQKINDWGVVTASTKEIQQFILKYVKDDKSFDSSVTELHRKTDAAPEKKE